MADPRIIQPSIRADERARIFWELCDRLADLDIDSLINIYNIDTVPGSVLPHLAEQFLVTGYHGWILADTEFKRRSLIKNAIVLHQKAGTPYAIKLALETLGYTDIIITENPEFAGGLRLYNAELNYDGTQNYGGIFRGTFIVDLNVGGILSAEEEALVIALINTWKNARSQLIELRTTETLRYNDRATYNAEWNYDGVPIV